MTSTSATTSPVASPGETVALAPGEAEPPRASLSPSRASDFLTCPLLYRFRVIDRLPEAPSPAGDPRHGRPRVLERLFDLPAAERTPQRAGELVRPEWERLLAAEPELGELFTSDGARDEWLASAQGLLDAYFALEDPQRLEPAERELYVECDLESGLRLRGYVDRLDVAPGGEVRVVDYKTGRAPREGFEAKAMFQMRFYALVLWRLHGRCPEPAAAALPRQRRGAALRARRGRPARHRAQARARSGRPSRAPPRRATGARAPAGCATGATTRPLPRLRRHPAAAADAARSRGAPGPGLGRATLTAHAGGRGLAAVSGFPGSVPEFTLNSP